MDVPTRIDVALGKKWCLVRLVHHVGKPCMVKGPDGHPLRCTSCGSDEHHYIIYFPNIKGKTNMYVKDTESDEKERYTRSNDEIDGSWMMVQRTRCTTRGAQRQVCLLKGS